MREIVSEEDVLGGDPRLDGTRVGVLHVYRQYQDGTSPEAIASNYDDVSVADVHTALAFVFDNPELIRRMERETRDVVARIRDRRPVDPDDFKQQS